MTNEEKARIFCAYIWSSVRCKYNKDQEETIKRVHPANLHELLYETSYCSLLLKSLEAITNEDAIFIYETIVGKALGEKYTVSRNNTDVNVESIWNCDVSDEDKITVYIPHSLEIYWNEGGKIKEVDGVRMQIIIDYLRANGYNVGYGPYSPADLIKSGVVRTIKMKK